MYDILALMGKGWWKKPCLACIREFVRRSSALPSGVRPSLQRALDTLLCTYRTDYTVLYILKGTLIHGPDLNRSLSPLLFPHVLGGRIQGVSKNYLLE